jgi:hypothetical protein
LVQPCSEALEFGLFESSTVRGEASQLISGFTKALQFQVENSTSRGIHFPLLVLPMKTVLRERKSLLAFSKS